MSQHAELLADQHSARYTDPLALISVYPKIDGHYQKTEIGIP